MSHRNAAAVHYRRRTLGPALPLVILALGACGPLRFPELVDASDAGTDTTDGEPDATLDAELTDAPFARDAETEDGSADASIDAADAEPEDGGVDAGVPDSGLPVTVVVRRSGLAAPGVRVLFHGADGRILSSTTTSERGEATGHVGALGMVTLVESLESDIAFHLETITETRPGDEMVFELSEPTIVGHVESQIPDIYPGAEEYSIVSRCIPPEFPNNTDPVALDVPLDCFLEDPSPTIVAVAADAERRLLAFSYVTNVPLVAGATVSAVLPPWRSDLRSLDVHVRNVPAETAYVEASYQAMIDGRLLNHPVARPRVLGDSGSDFTFATLPEISDEAFVSVNWRSTQSPDSLIARVLRLAPTSTSATVDLTASNMPAIIFDGVERSVPERPVYQWSNGPRTFDFGILMTSFSTPAGPAMWTVAFSSGQRGSIRLPQLPTDVPGLAPPLDAMPTPVILTADVDDVASYDESKVFLPGLLWQGLGRGQRPGVWATFGIGQ